MESLNRNRHGVPSPVLVSASASASVTGLYQQMHDANATPLRSPPTRTAMLSTSNNDSSTRFNYHANTNANDNTNAILPPQFVSPVHRIVYASRINNGLNNNSGVSVTPISSSAVNNNNTSAGTRTPRTSYLSSAAAGTPISRGSSSSSSSISINIGNINNHINNNAAPGVHNVPFIQQRQQIILQQRRASPSLASMSSLGASEDSSRTSMPAEQLDADDTNTNTHTDTNIAPEEHMYRNSHPFVSTGNHNQGFITTHYLSSSAPKLPVLFDSFHSSSQPQHQALHQHQHAAITPSISHHETVLNAAKDSFGFDFSSWDNATDIADTNTSASDNTSANCDYSAHDHDTLSVATGLCSLKRRRPSTLDDFKDYGDTATSSPSDLLITDNTDANNTLAHANANANTNGTSSVHHLPSIVNHSSLTQVSATPKRDTQTTPRDTKPKPIASAITTPRYQHQRHTPRSIPLKKRRVVGFGEQHIPSFLMEQFRPPNRSFAISNEAGRVASSLYYHNHDHDHNHNHSRPRSIPIRPRTLALPSDQENVNSLHTFVRSSLLEIFQVEDGHRKNERPTSSPNKHLFGGRVGLCCVWCKNVPKREQMAHSRIFPKTLEGLYRSVCGFQRIHFKNCGSVPRDVMDRYDFLKNTDKTRGKTKYWETSARAIGLVNFCEEGRKGVVFSSSV